ncbi:MAG: hypothetical protein WA885_02890 [Phormidesmis sp.]
MSFSYRVCLTAGVLGSLLGWPLASAQPAKAQSNLPACPPPSAQEYLLLIRGSSESERSQIASILPADNPVLICQYLNEALVRAGNFTSLETANAWASYMTTVEGFESFVSRPATSTAAATGQPAPSSTAPSSTAPSSTVSSSTVSSSTGSGSTGSAYEPRRLAPGYAVLVEYGDRPEVASAVGQVVRPVGLAVYQQRAYLLADYTGDADSATATLQRLSDAQLAAVLVDAQQVVRLTSEIASF